MTLALGGCAGAPAHGTTAAARAVAAAARRDPAEQQKIAQCLQAAGLPVPSFAPRPTRIPGEPPPTRTPRPEPRRRAVRRPQGPRGPAGLRHHAPHPTTGRERWRHQTHRHRPTGLLAHLPPSAPAARHHHAHLATHQPFSRPARLAAPRPGRIANADSPRRVGRLTVTNFATRRRDSGLAVTDSETRRHGCGTRGSQQAAEAITATRPGRRAGGRRPRPADGRRGAPPRPPPSRRRRRRPRART